MTTVQFINTMLTLLLPIMIWIGYPITQVFIQRMPMHQQASLERFSRMAVRYVEHTHLASPDKKALATAYASDMFRLFGLPVPHEDILEVAIGAAMYEMKSNG